VEMKGVGTETMVGACMALYSNRKLLPPIL